MGPRREKPECEHCQALPIWLRDWPGEVVRQLRGGIAPDHIKTEGRELWEAYCDRVVNAMAGEIEDRCKRLWVSGERRSRTTPWDENVTRKSKLLRVFVTHRGKFWTGRFDGGGRCVWTEDRDEAAVFSKREPYQLHWPLPIGARLVDIVTGETVLERLA